MSPFISKLLCVKLSFVTSVVCKDVSLKFLYLPFYEILGQQKCGKNTKGKNIQITKSET